MQKRRRKFSRMRGSRRHGGGHKKKKRGGGSRGGRGFSGYHKHKYSKVVSQMPDHYGKKGFPSLNDRDVIINIDGVVKLAKGKKELDLEKEGYTKLLGKGRIDFAIDVKVRKCTASAREKIEAAGGKITGAEESE